MINHGKFPALITQKTVALCDSLLPLDWAAPPPQRSAWTRQPLTICQLKYFFREVQCTFCFDLYISTQSGFSTYSLKWHTSWWRQVDSGHSRVLSTCWPQLWPGHTAAGGKRVTLVPSFLPPLSLSPHLPPLLTEHQSKRCRIGPKLHFEGWFSIVFKIPKYVLACLIQLDLIKAWSINHDGYHPTKHVYCMLLQYQLPIMNMPEDEFGMQQRTVTDDIGRG